MSKTDTKKGAPPLNAVRVFVAAARCLSFSRAARELGMTQSGVSHHVAGLERHLGHRLFARRGAALALTDAGRLYFDTVGEAVATIELATSQLAPAPPGGGLVVRTSLPTFAMAVLIPALPHFTRGRALAVEVVTSLSPPAAEDVYDVLISRDLAVGDDGAHWILAAEELTCVATPQVLRDNTGKPVDEWPFIIAKSRPDTLAAWTNRQAIDPHRIRIAAAFEHYFLAIPAAVAGMGFLVAPRLLVAGALAEGRLAETDRPALRGDARYQACINPRSAAPEAAKEFCRWLAAQVKDARGNGRDAAPEQRRPA